MVEPRFALRPVEDLRPHEEVSEERVAEIAEGIRSEGILADPLVVDRETDVVLDGHHRLAALERLGCDRAPVYLVEYRNDGIDLDVWREGRPPPSKDEVIARAKAGDLFPPKTTRHRSVKGFEPAPVRLRELR